MARVGRTLLAAVLVLGGCKQHRAPVPPSSSTPTWTNSLGMRFVPVQGCAAWFSVTETRDTEFQQFVKETGTEWIPPDAESGGEYPAANITWDDAVAFCAWLSRREHASGFLPQAQRYRLPTD